MKRAVGMVEIEGVLPLAESGGQVHIVGVGEKLVELLVVGAMRAFYLPV